MALKRRWFLHTQLNTKIASRFNIIVQLDEDVGISKSYGERSHN